jgi:dethiobiotin synthetase/adenosylmethionine--8-amino-7-oxononanoate aminotransferase
VCRTLYAWREAVSPHLAAEREGMAVEDAHVRSRLAACLVEGENLEMGEGEVWKLVETAGGVASPGPSGTLQCDLYRCVLMLLYPGNMLLLVFCLPSVYVV